VIVLGRKRLSATLDLLVRLALNASPYVIQCTCPRVAGFEDFVVTFWDVSRATVHVLWGLPGVMMAVRRVFVILLLLMRC
jgi:hypothetical protein